jgi:ribulose-phosphate 3-epimerase
MEIIPAILPKNFKEIEEGVELLNGISDVVQIDICDGKFVPSITWPYWKSEVKPEENFEAIVKEERGMPGWEEINYEFDLMIQNPTADDARKWLSTGAERIVLHLASSDDLKPAIDVLHGLVEMGIAINNNANVSDLKKYSDKIQFVQVMGIRKAGFQRQNFEMSTIDKVKEVKAMFPDLKVQVDGGVNLDNAVLLKKAGVDALVAGSAIFDKEDIFEVIEEFKSI